MSWWSDDLFDDKPLWRSINTYVHSKVHSKKYKLSSRRLYDSDIKAIITRASKKANSKYVTKALLIKTFGEYCRDNGLTIKIETFLRKVRKYASQERYIAYTVKKGVYRVLF